MVAISMVPEDAATGRVKEIYDEIKATLGTDFVPNLYRAMAASPDLLDANWRKVKTVMIAPGKLDGLTKEIVAVTVAAMAACDY